jgi:uncharacterized membrane protein (DUF4010 family)
MDRTAKVRLSGAMDIDVDWHSYSNLLLALAIGLLIGLERGWSARGEAEGRRIAGLRTFGLIGLTGGISGLLAANGQIWVLPGFALGLSALLAVGYWQDIQQDRIVSATTVVAGLLTFALGAAATLGLALEAAGSAVIAAMLLLLREDLHAWTRSLDEREMQAVLRFLLLAVVVVPILPDRSFGPYDALNPFKIGLVVVVLSGLSFAGYWATRFFGAKRGLLFTAAAGGLVSSTAVTYAFARFSQDHQSAGRALAAGVTVASVIMVSRVLVLLSVLSPGLLTHLLAPLLCAGLAGCTMAWWLVRDDERQPLPERIVANPFDLGPALFFAGVLAAMLLASRWAMDVLGERGLFAVTALTALLDVDAVIVSLSQMPEATLPHQAASAALALAVVVNTLIKPAVVAVLGSRAMLRALLAAMAAMLLAGAAGAGVAEAILAP